MKPDTVSTHSIEGMIPLLIQVQRDIDQDLNLDALAKRFGYSPYHFHRLFKETVGETPRQYVQRLRLEKAAYKLSISAASILEISLATGFRNHETFARAFRQHFGCTPSAYRAQGRIAQNERLERNRGFRGDKCVLSDVSFESLRPMHLLSIRNLGDYHDIPAPFSKRDRLWSQLVRWADARGVSHTRLPLGLFHDDPTVTPKPAQRCDACIPVSEKVAGTQRIRCLDFTGGDYGLIEHRGPDSTLIQGFRQLADGIRRSRQWEFRDGPAIEIVRNEHLDAESTLNRTDIYFPVKKKEMKTRLKRVALVLLTPIVAWSILCNLESIAMIKEHREITVRQPRQKVFDFLTDESKISSWVNGIVSIEPFGEPAEGLGAKARIAVNVPTEMTMVSTISEWEPPRRFAWSVDVDAMASQQVYDLDEIEGGTRITLTVEHRLKGFFLRLLSPLISWQIKSERAKEMERLKKVLDELE